MSYICLKRTKQKKEGTVFLHFVHRYSGQSVSLLQIKYFNNTPHTVCVKTLLFLETYRVWTDHHSCAYGKDRFIC